MLGRNRGSARGRPDAGGAGTKDDASDLVRLVIAYAKQETLGPVMGQLKAVRNGIAGAVLVSLGTVFLSVGFVRAVQAEVGSSRVVSAPVSALPTVRPVPGTPAAATQSDEALRAVLARAPYGAGSHLSGDWSWVPYMGGALFCVAVAGFCVVRIWKGAVR
jgi:hypothetical protein